jgi:hypothetical protein
LEVDRPVLPITKFEDLKSSLLDKSDTKNVKKPQTKFLDVENDEAHD